MKRDFNLSFHFSNILCRTLLLVLFPHSRALCDQLNDNKEGTKFWALHTLQYLDYNAEVLANTVTCDNHATFLLAQI